MQGLTIWLVSANLLSDWMLPAKRNEYILRPVPEVSLSFAGIPECLVLGPDGYIYMETICGAHLLCLDPKTGIVTDLGKPVKTRVNIWNITVAPDLLDKSAVPRYNDR